MTAAGEPTFTLTEVFAILGNMGHDVECGACMSVAFVGAALPWEAHTCPEGECIRALREGKADDAAPKCFGSRCGGECYWCALKRMHEGVEAQPLAPPLTSCSACGKYVAGADGICSKCKRRGVTAL